MTKRYTKAQRKEIRAQLVAAKPLLQRTAAFDSKRYEFICYAVARAAGKFWHDDSAHDLAAIKLVMSRLYPCKTVNDFLVQATRLDYDSKTLGRHIQAYRHLWLDALIQEFAT